MLTTPETVYIPDVQIQNYRNPFEGKGSPFESEAAEQPGPAPERRGLAD